MAERKMKIPNCTSPYAVYSKLVKESQGFDLKGVYAGSYLAGGIVEVPRHKWSRYEPMAAQFAVDEYNKTQNASLELVEIVRLNGQSAGGMMFFITLKTRDKNNDDVEEFYRAKVYMPVKDPDGHKFKLKFFVPDPSSQERGASEEKKEKLSGSSFMSFANDLRSKHPDDFSRMKYRKFLKLAGARWRSLSPEEKMSYAEGRSSPVKVSEQGCGSSVDVSEESK